MKIKAAEFIISAAGPEQYPDDGLPEFALAGRSNVGKSSLINKMMLRKNLAHTSSQPGKTQLLNYYKITSELAEIYMVDFPGYGYAKVSHKQREEWGRHAESYLLNRETLKKVLLVVDFRHPPTADDCMMYEWLKYHEIPCCIVATKADKVPRSKWQKHLKQVKTVLEADPADAVIMFSSELGIGREELWKELLQSV